MTGRQIVERYLDAFQSGRYHILDNVLADNYAYEHEGMPQPLDKKTYIMLAKALRAAFPDWNFHGRPAGGNSFFVEGGLQITGTHTGILDLSFMGGPIVPPTGQKVALPRESCTWQIAGGQIVRHKVQRIPGAGLDGILAQVKAASTTLRH